MVSFDEVREKLSKLQGVLNKWKRDGTSHVTMKLTGDGCGTITHVFLRDGGRIDSDYIFDSLNELDYILDGLIERHDADPEAN